MASVKRGRGTRYWVGCYRLPNGKRKQRSTKSADKSNALTIAKGWERAARLHATKDQAARVLADIVKEVSGDIFAEHLAHEYADRWLKRMRAEKADRTADRYEDAVKEFKASVPGHVAMADVPTATIATIRDAVAARTSNTSANLILTAIKAMFKAAWSDGIIADNPAEKVKRLDTKREDAEKVHRRPFRDEEVSKMFKVVAVEDEWHGFMLFADDTGQRLGDIAKKAESKNIAGDIWSFESAKAGKQMRIALTPRILEWMKKHAPASGPVFPKLAAVSRSGTLSNRFYKIMAQAGLVPKRSVTPLGKGRKSRRQANEISFHSFRHTAQSWLIANNMSRENAMAVIGHDDEETNKGYTHVSDTTLRKAAKLLAKRKR